MPSLFFIVNECKSATVQSRIKVQVIIMQELRVNKTRNLSSCKASEDILLSKARKVPNLSWAVFINQVTSRKLVRTDRTSEDSSGLREAALKCAEVLLPTIRYHQVRFFFILSSSSSEK